MHAAQLSRKGAPSEQSNNLPRSAPSQQSNNAPRSDARDSVARVRVRRMEAHGGATASASHEDALLGWTLLSSLRLNHWGSQASGGKPDNLDHLSKTHETLGAFHIRRAQSQSVFGKFTMLLLTVALLITCLSLLCACFGRWWDADEDEMKAPDPTLAAVEYCNGPWARAYRESHGKRREAIELLFKCNIITMPEFANYAVSGQHSDIDECVQIGVCMLQERSISEWEARWQEAQQTFEKMAADGQYRTPI